MSKPAYYSGKELKRIHSVWDKYTTKQERFIGVLIELSVSKDPETCLDEWSSYDHPYEAEQCICSQHIKKSYPFINERNGEIVVIGSECVAKFGSDGMKSEQKLKQSLTTYTGSKRMCESCMCHRISSKKDNYVTKCKSCYKDEAEVNPAFVKMCYRPCPGCGVKTHPNYIKCLKCLKEPVVEGPRTCLDCKVVIGCNYTRCYKCFEKSKTGSQVTKPNVPVKTQVTVDMPNRKCMSCNKYNIAATEPAYKKDCLQCWLAKRK